MWRKELSVIPVNGRVIIAVAQCRTSKSIKHINFLSSTNQTVDEFRHTLEHTEKHYDTYHMVQTVL